MPPSENAEAAAPWFGCAAGTTALQRCCCRRAYSDRRNPRAGRVHDAAPPRRAVPTWWAPARRPAQGIVVADEVGGPRPRRVRGPSASMMQAVIAQKISPRTRGIGTQGRCAPPARLAPPRALANRSLQTAFATHMRAHASGVADQELHWAFHNVGFATPVPPSSAFPPASGVFLDFEHRGWRYAGAFSTFMRHGGCGSQSCFIWWPPAARRPSTGSAGSTRCSRLRSPRSTQALRVAMVADDVVAAAFAAVGEQRRRWRRPAPCVGPGGCRLVLCNMRAHQQQPNMLDGLGSPGQGLPSRWRALEAESSAATSISRFSRSTRAPGSARSLGFAEFSSNLLTALLTLAIGSPRSRRWRYAENSAKPRLHAGTDMPGVGSA